MTRPIITDEDKLFLKQLDDDDSPIMYTDMGLLRTQLSSGKICDGIDSMFYYR